MSWAVIWRFLGWSIPLPLWLLIGAGVWWQFDRHSFARKAVVELVAGAELEAERAKDQSAQLVADELERQREALRAANARFEEDLNRARRSRDEVEVEIRELLARPADGSCSVDSDLLGRLRNR